MARCIAAHELEVLSKRFDVTEAMKPWKKRRPWPFTGPAAAERLLSTCVYCTYSASQEVWGWWGRNGAQNKLPGKVVLAPCWNSSGGSTALLSSLSEGTKWKLNIYTAAAAAASSSAEFSSAIQNNYSRVISDPTVCRFNRMTSLFYMSKIS